MFVLDDVDHNALQSISNLQDGLFTGLKLDGGDRVWISFSRRAAQSGWAIIIKLDPIALEQGYEKLGPHGVREHPSPVRLGFISSKAPGRRGSMNEQAPARIIISS